MENVEIKHKDIILSVYGVYEKKEDAVMRYEDGTGFPGSPSFFEAREIYLSDSKINIIDLLEDDLEEIEEMCKMIIEN